MTTIPQGRYQELDRLYRDLPKIDCKGLCQESCGPIGMSKYEDVRLRWSLGLSVWPPVIDPVTCPLLRKGKCSVYKLRPMICRLWGIVETMPCHHGCKPARYLTHGEGQILLMRAELISAETDSDRAEITDAIAWAEEHPEEFVKMAAEYRQTLDELEAAAAAGKETS